VTGFRFRLIDTAGSEIGIVTHDSPEIQLGEPVRLPDGRMLPVLDAYDDEHGRDGDVMATLVVDDE
jgi:hypothetical protein